MSRIYVIHENDAWVEPLRAAFKESELPFDEWFIDDGTLDLSETPPPGVFYNRMSASSHTRGHRYAAELTGGVLAWLESQAAAWSTTVARCNSKSARSHSTRRSPAMASACRALSPPSAATRSCRPHARCRPVHHQAQPRRQGPRRTAFDERRRARSVTSTATRSRLGRRRHAGPAIHPGTRAVHHARRVHRRQVPLRRARRYVARLRAVPGRRVPGRRCVCPVGETRSRCRRRRAFASSTASRIRSSTATGASSRTTASASPASSSSPIAPARSTRTTSTRTPITTPMPKLRPASSGCARSPRYLGEELGVLGRRPLRSRAAA